MIPIRKERPWTAADSMREAAKLMRPRQSPDVIAAEFLHRNPAQYEQWRRCMVISAKRTLRFYRYEQRRHHMTPARFREHMLSNYETAVVNQVYEELGMSGPRRVMTETIHDKINRRATNAKFVTRTLDFE